jgi:Zn-dependent protease
MFGPLTLIPRDPLIAVVLVAVFLLGLLLHNVAQAHAAARLGDPTARAAGFGGLRPDTHLGLPATVWYLLLGLGLPRAVPIKLRGRPAVLALLAGPAALIVFALGVAVVQRLLQPLLPGPDVVYDGMRRAVGLLLLHAVFFLLPLPHLDGGRALREVARRDLRGLLSDSGRLGPLVLYIVWVALWISNIAPTVLRGLLLAMQVLTSWLPV